MIKHLKELFKNKTELKKIYLNFGSNDSIKDWWFAELVSSLKNQKHLNDLDLNFCIKFFSPL